MILILYFGIRETASLCFGYFLSNANLSAALMNAIKKK